jgi:archaellum component FlaD/FlaE
MFRLSDQRGVVMDQTAINQIIMDAEAEEPSKKMEKLEKEVQILKGSIKKLIIDIREQMSNADNPFLNIQQFQVPAPSPTIKEQEIADEMGITPDEEEKNPGGKVGPEALGPARALSVKPEAKNVDVSAVEVNMDDIESQRKMLEDIRERAKGPFPAMGSRKLDPYTMTQIMEWTRTMLKKNGQERFNDMLDMYVSTGYISEEIKGVIFKVAKLMETEPQKAPRKLDIRECVSDLYTLYVILNPKDKELDSRMLSVLLDSESKHL